jgi:hypothetical protein
MFQNIIDIFKPFNLENYISEYEKINKNSFIENEYIEKFPFRTQKYKSQLIEILKSKIKNRDCKSLAFLLTLAWRDGFDSDYKVIFKSLILEKWHNCHEDIIDFIRDFKDDDFTDDIFIIAITPIPYRQFDDELEATLRKCIHALIEIDSIKSKEKIKTLLETKNPNIRNIVDMYQK